MSEKIIYLLDAFSSTGLTVGCRNDEIYNSDTGEILTPSADIIAKAEALEAEYDAQEYARNRATEYPALAEQLDEIYHNGIDSWKAVIKVTKDKYPKG